MEEKNIISPCISVCKTDPVSGFCYGCGRTNNDKLMWKSEATSNEWKINNPKLSKWFTSFIENDFMKSTLPREK